MAVTADITHNPWKITGTTTTNDKITDDQAYIKRVYWYNPTTEGHLVALKDINGNYIAQLICEGDNESLWYPVYWTYTGVYCDDMDSGTLYIYVK